MPLISATAENYPEILRRPGLTWVMFDQPSAGYRSKSTLKTEFRRLAKMDPAAYGVVYVDRDICRPLPEGLDFIPSFWLYRDGVRISGFTGRVSPKDFAATVERCLRQVGLHVPSTKDRIYSDLKHGVQLTVLNTSGQLTIRHVGDYLADQLKFFKDRRDTRNTELYLIYPPYPRTVKERRRTLGTVEIYCTKKGGITAAMWVDAIADAYPRISTVEQMLEAPADWQTAVNAQESYLRPVVAMLSEPGGDLLAMAALLERAASGA